MKSFRSAGILKRMEKIVYGKKRVINELHKEKFKNELDPVEFENIIPLFKSLAILYFFVILVLIIEIICNRIINK